MVVAVKGRSGGREMEVAPRVKAITEVEGFGVKA
jgi:hypothetical protein